MRVFLDGTENGSNWRQQLIPLLDEREIGYHDPTHDVSKSKREYSLELQQKKDSQYHIYVITPKIDDFENISELIDDSNKNPTKTIFSFLEEDDDLSFNSHR